MRQYNKHTLFVGLIVAANLLLSIYSILRDFATPDEIRQISAGCSNWQLGSFKLAGEDPPLARMIAVSPVLAADHSEWFLSYIDRPIHLDGTIQDRIFASFASENARQLVDLVRLARLAGLAWWLLGAWVIFRWCRALYGTRAGYVGLVLWCFEPNVLACEPLATPELPASVAALLASYAFWCYLRRSSRERTMISGLSLGAAALTGFSALLLYVLWPVLAASHWLAHRRDAGHVRRIGRRSGEAVLILLSSLWVINMGYGWTKVGRALGDFEFISHTLGGSRRCPDPFHANLPVGNRFRGSSLGEVPSPLAADYLLGLDLRCRPAEASGPAPAPGDGSTSTGAGDFTPSGFATRIPLGLLAMILWRAILALSRRPGLALRSDDLFWALPMLAIGGLATTRAGTHFLRGPALLLVPYAIIAASQLADHLRPGHRGAGGLVLALVAWVVSSGLSGFPHNRPYRNELVGRPDDRTIPRDDDGDGGRELLRLQDWRRRHPEATPLAVAVHHLVDPRDHGFTDSPPPVDPGSSYLHTVDPPPEIGPRPGYYAIDRSTLATGHFRYLRMFTPMDRIGPSLLIGRITPEGAERVRSRLGAAAAEEAKRKYLLAFERGISKESAFRFRAVEDSGGRRTNYALFVPGDYRGDTPYPLILFLHGQGDAGTEGRQYLNVGLPRIIEQSRDSHGFIVVCPQGRTGIWSPESEDAEQAMTILEAVQGEFNVDPKRIILTGLSSGGTGTWFLAARHPDRWAAIVPVSSAIDRRLAPEIRHIPCWCFHNCNDEPGYYHKYHAYGSSVELPRQLIRAIVEAGGSPRYTEFLGIGDTHNAWDAAYTMPELYDWLAKQRRP
jgi:predicted esterase